MAKRKTESSFKADDWLSFHGKRAGKLELDSHPAAADLLQQMLTALPQGAHVSWHKVAIYIRRAHPDAPAHAGTYKRFAERRLDWR